MSHRRSAETSGPDRRSLFVSGWWVVSFIAICAAVMAPPRTAAAIESPSRPADAVAAKAYDVLHKHCARCHQSGQRKKGAPSTDLDNILNLSDLVQEPGLVVPGRPDASSLYLSVLTRRMPLDAWHTDPSTKKGLPAPTIQDIKTIRQWIAQLPQNSARTCDELTFITAADQQLAIQGYLADLPQQQAVRHRFISIAHLYNACATPKQLSLYRKGVRALLDALTIATPNPTARSIDDNGAILSVRLDELGWTPRQWEQLALRQPLRYRPSAPDPNGIATQSAPVAADWLAAEATRLGAVSNLLGMRSSPHSWTDRIPQDKSHWVKRLARRYTRALDLIAASGEIGMSPATLRSRLDAYTGRHLALARRLQQRTVTRTEFERLAADLIRQPSAATQQPATPATGIIAKAAAAHSPPLTKEQRRDRRDALSRRPHAMTDPLTQVGVSLWVDKSKYHRGDELLISAQTDADCFLTIIDIDQTGRATVLFPNEYIRDNRVRAGQTITVPHADAPYVLKVEMAGQEQLVAICMPDLRTPPGIKRNYERQRFTILGDWETFLDKSVKSEEEMRRKARGKNYSSKKKKRRKRRRRRRSRFEPETPYRNDGRPEPQSRTAISITVE